MRAGSYHKRTALMGAARGEPVPHSQASCPAHSAARPQHRSLAYSSVQPCQLCLQIPLHPRKTRAHGLAVLREMPSKPHGKERQVSTRLPVTTAACGAALTAAGIVLGKPSCACQGAHRAVCAMASGFASCLGFVCCALARFRLMAAS